MKPAVAGFFSPCFAVNEACLECSAGHYAWEAADGCWGDKHNVSGMVVASTVLLASKGPAKAILPPVSFGAEFNCFLRSLQHVSDADLVRYILVLDSSVCRFYLFYKVSKDLQCAKPYFLFKNQSHTECARCVKDTF
jgi:hypothetical protein